MAPDRTTPPQGRDFDGSDGRGCPGPSAGRDERSSVVGGTQKGGSMELATKRRPEKVNKLVPGGAAQEQRHGDSAQGPQAERCVRSGGRVRGTAGVWLRLDLRPRRQERSASPLLLLLSNTALASHEPKCHLRIHSHTPSNPNTGRGGSRGWSGRVEVAGRFNWHTEELELFALLEQGAAITGFEVQVEDGLHLGGAAVTQQSPSAAIRLGSRQRFWSLWSASAR